MINYQVENNLSPEAFKSLLIQSKLAERRPVDDDERIIAMVKNSNLIITARDGARLVGVARSVTDFVYCTYLSDLAVDVAYQKLGIGTNLIRRTKQETPQASLILLAAPKAVNYYSHIGMTQHSACFYIKNEHELKE